MTPPSSFNDHALYADWPAESEPETKAFFAAIRAGDLKEMAALKAQHPDLVNRRLMLPMTVDGKVPLHPNLSCAVVAGHEEAVRWLIEAGVHIDALCGFSRGTPLLYAVEREKEKIVEILLQAGADPFASTADPAYRDIVFEGADGGIHALLVAAQSKQKNASEEKRLPEAMIAFRRLPRKPGRVSLHNRPKT